MRFGRPSPPYVPTLPCQICFISTAITAAISLRIYNHQSPSFFGEDTLISSVATEKRMMTRVIILTHHRLQRRRIVIVNSQTLILVTIASRMLKGPPLLIVYRLQRRRTVIVMMNHLRGSSRGRRNILYTLHGS